jgi:small subunit ribosomal protein S1
VRDYQETQESEEDDTSGPTTLGELSGLADLKAEMQQAERRETQQDVSEPEDVETADAEEAEAEEADAEEADVDEADADVVDAGEAEAADEAEAAAADAGDDSADDEEAEATASFDEQDGFPEHFPRASRLENAGVTSLAELREIDDFETIEGIGPSYADDIRAGLEEFDETGSIAPDEDA